MSEPVYLRLDDSALWTWIDEVTGLLELFPERLRRCLGRCILGLLSQDTNGRLFTSVSAGDGVFILGPGPGLQALASAMRAFKGDFTHD